MGKTKIKIVDDSAPIEEKKPSRKKPEEQKLDVGSEKIDKEIGSLKLEDQTSKIKPPKPASNLKHPTSKKVRSKKYREVSKDLDRNKSYPLAEAVDMVKKVNYAKFDATLEAHINMVQMGIRGFVSLPYASGKRLKILIFPPAKLTPLDKKELEDEGVVFGDDSTIDEIIKGKLDFDLVITTPEWMPKLAKAAKVLGPRGLMPNPKNGTITDNLKQAVESYQAGKTEYKTEAKAAVIHLALGKLTQPTEELSANIKTLLQALGKSKVKKVALSPTMGPSVKLDLASV